MQDSKEIIVIDPEVEYNNMAKRDKDFSFINLQKFRPNGVIFGVMGQGSAIRIFSEDVFNPKLVPSYVKNVSVRYDSNKRKKYFTYIDDYGRGET